MIHTAVHHSQDIFKSILCYFVLVSIFVCLSFRLYFSFHPLNLFLIYLRKENVKKGDLPKNVFKTLICIIIPSCLCTVTCVLVF